MEWIFRYFLLSWYYLPKPYLSFDKLVRVMRINASCILNAHTWTPKINRRPGRILGHLQYFNAHTLRSKSRARRKHCFSSFFFPLVGKPTSCRSTSRLFLMLRTVMYPQRYHIRVSVIPILVTMEELAVKQLQASLAHVRQITRDLSVKVRTIMFFVNRSLKKTNFVF